MAGNIRVTGGGLAGLKRHLAGLLTGKTPGVKVGAMEGATYSEGPLAGEPVAVNLARHEFGTEHIPARAPFRRTIEKKKGEWGNVVAQYLRSSSGRIDVRAAMTQAGDYVAMEIQQSFEDGLQPELKPETIRRKEKMGYTAHASTPVMLTGQTQRSITAEYVEDLSTVLGGSNGS